MENESRFETISGTAGRLEEPLRIAARVAGGRFHLTIGITEDGPSEIYVTHWHRTGLYGHEECTSVCRGDDPDALARITTYAYRKRITSPPMADNRQQEAVS